MKPGVITVTDIESKMWDINIDSISHYNELGSGITSIVLTTPDGKGGTYNIQTNTPLLDIREEINKAFIEQQSKL